MIVRGAAILVLLPVPMLASAQQSPFDTGANSLVTFALAIATPIAILVVIGAAIAAAVGRISWGWVASAIVGITRRPMRRGVAYEALLLNLVGTMEVFVMTKNLLTLLIAIPIHGVCALLCARDVRFFHLMLAQLPGCFSLRPRKAPISSRNFAAIAAARRSAAMQKALMREALSAASRRFESIQQLIDAIAQRRFSTCRRARIQTEQGMLQNEATKLGVLYQARRPKSGRASSAYARPLPRSVLSVTFLRGGFDMTN